MRVAVELAGKTPILMNRRWGRVPGGDDHEQARKRLFVDGDGSYWLLPAVPVMAISLARLARRWGRDARLPSNQAKCWPFKMNEATSWPSLRVVGRCEFDSPTPWTPFVQERRGGGMKQRLSFPCFKGWSVSFTLDFRVDHYNPRHIRLLLEEAGRTCGLYQFVNDVGEGWGRFDVASWEPKVAAWEAADLRKTPSERPRNSRSRKGIKS